MRLRRFSQEGDAIALEYVFKPQTGEICLGLGFVPQTPLVELLA
ncbi:hypothetical protein WKK05_06885 [Nostoc sp. UHCC 0302]